MRSQGLIGLLRGLLHALAALLVLAAIMSHATAHEIPNDVKLSVFFKPTGNRLLLLIRAPTADLRAAALAAATAEVLAKVRELAQRQSRDAPPTEDAIGILERMLDAVRDPAAGGGSALLLAKTAPPVLASSQLTIEVDAELSDAPAAVLHPRIRRSTGNRYDDAGDFRTRPNRAVANAGLVPSSKSRRATCRSTSVRDQKPPRTVGSRGLSPGLLLA